MLRAPWPFRQAGKIVAEGDVENPVEAVPDGPVVADCPAAPRCPAPSIAPRRCPRCKGGQRPQA